MDEVDRSGGLGTRSVWLVVLDGCADAPDDGTPFAAESGQFLASLMAPESTVWVHGDQDPVDQYGEGLLYVWTDDGTFVNREIVTAGLATAALIGQSDLYYTEMLAAEQAAKNAQRALWEDPSPPPDPPDPPEPQPLVDAPEPEEEPVGGGCDAAYSGVCIPPAPPDLDCPDVSAQDFAVRPPDPHGFDRDQDGIGCES